MELDDETAEGAWAGDFDPFSDAEERRVLFAALDSFRYVPSIPASPAFRPLTLNCTANTAA